MSKYNSLFDIKEILNDYTEDIQNGLKRVVKDVAKDAVKDLKLNSPKNKKNSSHKGKYAKGWRVNTKEGKNFINCTIHNATDYQLTHLLEKGHLLRQGGKANPVVHIAPIEEKANKEYVSETEKMIKNGG